MGICASCITRDSDMTKRLEKKAPTFEIKTFEFDKSESFDIEENLVPKTKKREEKIKKAHFDQSKIKKMEVLAELECLLTEEKEEPEREIKKSQNKSKILRKKMFKKSSKKKKKEWVNWTEDDEQIYKGISKNYGQDSKVLLKHFHNKRKLLHSKIFSLSLEKCKQKISINNLKDDYIKFQGNWELLAKKYGIDSKILRIFFYGYVYQMILCEKQKNNPDKKEISAHIMKNENEEDKKSKQQTEPITNIEKDQNIKNSNIFFDENENLKHINGKENEKNNTFYFNFKKNESEIIIPNKNFEKEEDDNYNTNYFDFKERLSQAPKKKEENEVNRNVNSLNSEKGKISEITVSKKKEPNLSEVNDDNNLLEEKISYLSARKEILESLQKYLNDEEGANEEDD